MESVLIECIKTNNKELDFSFLNLSKLPPLPNHIEVLYCNGNNLKELPKLPPNLIVLDCSRNFLTSLPLLPKNLEYLKCSHNELVELPYIPYCVKLICNDNKIVDDTFLYYFKSDFITRWYK